MLQKFFCDKQGRVVLAQAPNVPLWVWIGCAIGKRIVEPGTVHTVLDVAGIVAISVWAGMELHNGATPFRRVLGAVVLTATIVGVVGRLH